MYFEFPSNLISYPFPSCTSLIWDPRMQQACHNLRIFVTAISSISNILHALWVDVPVSVCLYLHENPRINGIHGLPLKSSLFNLSTIDHCCVSFLGLS